jgi:hypothetical protein
MHILSFSRYLLLLILLTPAASVLAPRAQADDFTISAQIFCPMFITQTGRGSDWDTDYNATPQPGPCAGIFVTAMDSDNGPDDFCGSAFTDSRGRFTLPAHCGDPGNNPPDVYLRIEARSMRGFSVGFHDWGVGQDIGWVLADVFTGGGAIPAHVWDWLTHNTTHRWTTTTQLNPDNGRVDFGALSIGSRVSGHFSQAGARQWSAAQFSMSRLQRGLTAIAPMFFRYTVDHVIGFPTTVWNTIIVSDQRMRDEQPRMLRASAHEIGHVLHNTIHSDQLHWLADSVDYMRSHSQCVSESDELAWYEGFANFIRDYVNAQSSAGNAPFRGCGLNRRGIDFEGNVQAFLNEIYFGTDSVEPDRNDYSCPQDLYLVEHSGDFWCESQFGTHCGFQTILDSRLIDRQGYTDVCRDCTTTTSGGPITCTETPVYCAGAPAGSQGIVIPVMGEDICYVAMEAGLLEPVNPGAGAAPRGDRSPPHQLAQDNTPLLTWFGLPALNRVIRFVGDAGTGRHSASAFWNATIRPFCTQTSDAFGRDWYCNVDSSRNFRINVQRLDSQFQ